MFCANLKTKIFSYFLPKKKKNVSWTYEIDSENLLKVPNPVQYRNDFCWSISTLQEYFGGRI